MEIGVSCVVGRREGLVCIDVAARARERQFERHPGGLVTRRSVAISSANGQAAS